MVAGGCILYSWGRGYGRGRTFTWSCLFLDVASDLWRLDCEKLVFHRPNSGRNLDRRYYHLII